MLRSNSTNDIAAKFDAINRSQAVIEFELDGTIITANENFLKAIGYRLDEIRGRHHRIFVETAQAESREYHAFWAKLARGEYDAGEYKRIAKGGHEIWIQASYNPVLDKNGKPVKVIKFATDITRQKLQDADYHGQIDAISKAQAVIEFNLDGTIITANENFLSTMGYRLDEVQGKHHRMFADPEYANSEEYKEFWNKLNRGEYDAGEYRRFGKAGKEVWIHASYNPIMDMSGKPFKVVKYASDVTKEKLEHANSEGQLNAIDKAQAVIEFNLDGTIIRANDNFLKTVGYSLSEVQGRHHRMFVEPVEANGQAYADFWAKLNRGEFESRVYKRIGKGGREVYIQASYNPIMDMNGKPFKVVKFASDMTELMKTVDLTESATGQVQNVAAATEEMSASIGEISKNMTLARHATDNISQKTASSGEASARLASTMQSMESIVNLIRSIAGQVNLLALNATIEAARAGEAGKGFAVVASEVKNLATQTSKATDDIANEIASVQTLSAEVGHSIQQIVDGAADVSQYVTGVAGAIEEQTAVTREISSNIQSAASSVIEVGDRIKKLSQAA